MITTTAAAPSDKPKANKPKPAAAEAPAVQTADTQTVAEVAGHIIDPARVGIYSEHLSLIANLGDPSNLDNIPDGPKVKDAEGNEKQEFIKKPRIVGYRFKWTGPEPLVIDEFGLSEKWSYKNRLDHSEEGTARTIKSGEEFDLTLFETALMVARPEFNLLVSGGNFPVRGRFGKKKASSTDEVDSDQSKTFSLGSATRGGESSKISDAPYIDILKADHVATEAGTSQWKNHQILPEFEKKFAPVAQNRGRRASTRTRTASATPAQATYAPAAFAFLASNKQAKAASESLKKAVVK